MMHHRTSEEVRRFDIGKLIVLIILIILLLLSWFSGRGQPQEPVAEVPTDITTTTTPETSDAATAAPEEEPTVAVDEVAEEAPPVAIALPVLDPPEGPVPVGEILLAGTAEPGNRVAILVDGEQAGTAEVGDDGRWTLPVDLAEGERQIVVQTVDDEGTVLNEAEAIAFNVAQPAGEIAAEVSIPSIIPPDGETVAGEYTLMGVGTPGREIVVLVDGEEVGTTVVGDDGTWSLPIELASGSQEVVAQTLDSNGSVLNESEPLTIEVPEVEVAAPELPDLGFGLPEFNPFNGFYTWRGTAEPGAEVALVVEGEVAQTATADADGNWSLSDTFDPGELDIQFAVLDEEGEVAAESEPTTLDLGLRPPRFDLAGMGLPDADLDAPDFEFNLPGGLFTWSGQGEPGTTVEVVVDGESIGTTTVDEEGNWTLEGELEPGEYELQLRWLDDSGEVLSESAATPVVVLEGTTPTVDLPDDGLEPGTVTLTGTAAPGAELEIVVNGEVVGTTTAGADGSWSLDVELSEGENLIQVQTLDAEGNVVLQSEEMALAVGDVGDGTADGEVVDTDGTVIEALEEAGNFTTFLAAVDGAELAETFDGEGPFTIFAPTDEAFANLPEEVQEGILDMPTALLGTMLEAHVVEGALTAEDVAAAETLETLTGDELAVIVGDGDDETAVRVEGATLLGPVMMAGNSVIHPIDRVLLPSSLAPADIRAPVIDDSGVPTFECCALTVVGNAQPGTEIVLLANGEQYGETATVDEDGFWLVAGEVTVGNYDLVALMFGESGNLLGVSPRVFLAVTE